MRLGVIGGNTTENDDEKQLDGPPVQLQSFYTYISSLRIISSAALLILFIAPAHFI